MAPAFFFGGMMEYHLQIAIANVLRLSATRGTTWFAVPNEGARSPRNGKRMKDMGRRAGVPDLIIVVKSTPHSIECKKPKEKQSQAQRDMEQEFREAGVSYTIVDNLDQAILLLKDIGAIRPTK